MKPVQNMQSMKPVQYIQVSYLAHFSRLFFFNFEIKFKTDIFIFFLFYFTFIFIFFFFWGGGGSVEVILEDFISEIV